MAKSTSQRRTRQRESAVVEETKIESRSPSSRQTRQSQNAVEEATQVSRSTSVRRTRQRQAAVDDDPKEKSPSSTFVLTTGKKRRADSEMSNGFHGEAAGIVACEGQSPSRKKVKAPSPRGANKFEEEVPIIDLEDDVKEESKGDAVCEETLQNSSGKKKKADSVMANGFHGEAAGIIACEGQSPTRKKVKSPSPRGANKFEEEVRIIDLEHDVIEERKVDAVCEETLQNSSGKKKEPLQNSSGKKKVPLENSSFKKKGVSAKKVSKAESDDETVCMFIGNTVPVEEAKRRWPHRYTKKAIGKKSTSTPGNEDEDEPIGAKCHYYQAMVDGIVYNLNDNAHVKAGDNEPNYIGRIIEFFKTVDEQLYFRAQWFYKAEDTVIGNHGSDHDKRRVFLSEDKNDNDLDCIVNKIRIIRITNNIVFPAKKEIPDCDYYYDMSYSISYSTFANLPKDDTSGLSSLSTTSSEEGSELEASSSNATLLDLYCGCGAMSTGLYQGAQLAGLNLYTAWAVDINPYACESLRLNHPKTKVRNEKAEDFLVLIKEWKKLCEKYSLDVKHPPKPNKESDEISDDEGNDDSTPVPNGEFEVDHFLDICYGDPNEIGKKQLMFKVRWKGYGPSEDTWEPVSGLSKCTERIENFVRKGYKNKILPLPGVADVICGGPPCQGISGFNRFRDSQNPLADVRNQQMEVYMEIVDFLKPKYVLMENVVDILKFAEGFLGRFAISKLVKMNYQSRLGIMAAGCFGLPQFRMRVFLWGAQSNQVLPQYPLPTHDVLVRGGAPVKFEPNIVAYNENQRAQAKLAKALLLGDAISDLPKVENNETRDEIPYEGRPITNFQYSIRLVEADLGDPNCNPKKANLQKVLFDHRPLRLNDDDYMRVCRIPKKKGANFRDLPGIRVGPNNVVEFIPDFERVMLPSGSPLIPDYAMSFIKGKSPKPFGRLWWDETVPTVVTRAEPHNQIILHPEQDRVLSIRENARLQGFPDYYKLCGPIKERYIQVGNAVAMPVSRALGYSLGRAFQGKGSDDPVFTLPPNFPHFGAPAGEAINC